MSDLIACHCCRGQRYSSAATTMSLHHTGWLLFLRGAIWTCMCTAAVAAMTHTSQNMSGAGFYLTVIVLYSSFENICVQKPSDTACTTPCLLVKNSRFCSTCLDVLVFRVVLLRLKCAFILHICRSMVRLLLLNAERGPAALVCMQMTHWQQCAPGLLRMAFGRQSCSLSRSKASVA